MKQQFILAALLLLATAFIQVIRSCKGPERGITITQVSRSGHWLPGGSQKVYACLPIRPRKRWLKWTILERYWRPTRRIVKNPKTGKKIAITGKAPGMTKKVLLNPA